MDTDNTGRYVCIDPRFKLRGWLGMPHALLDSLTATAHPISKGVFDTLLLCNGAFRPTDAVFLGMRKAMLAQLEREGVLAFSDEPTALACDQEYRYYPNHYMRQVQWSMTGRCNYRCRHCFMSAPHAVLPQPTTEECLHIADQMADCGVQVVKLTGGECLVRPDFLQVVEHLMAVGIQVATIMSNGALVSEELLKGLEDCDVRCGFDISFDGVGGWHDWLRGMPGAEDAAIRAFRLCRERGFPTGAEVTLHRDSAPALRETVRLLGKLGVQSVLVGSVDDEGEAHGMRDRLLSYDELFDLCCTYLPQFLEDGAPVRHITLGGIFEVTDGMPRLARGRTDWGERSAGLPACGTIRSTLYLGPDGAILPCASMAYDGAVQRRFPNLSQMTLSEALTSSSYDDLVGATVGDVLAHDPACAACAYRGRCLGGCRAKGVDEHGDTDLLGRDPESCRFFLGGYYDRARELVESLVATA